LKKLFIFLMACNVHAYQLEPVFDAIFPYQYFIGSYVGLPSSPAHGSYLIMPELNDHNVFLYAWSNPGYNRSSAKNSNLPIGFAIVPNQLELDQAVIALEKPLNTIQHESVDFGFKVTNLAGIDYRYTTMAGVLSQQLVNNNNLYGYDLPEFYINAYLPSIAKGTVVTLGRYQSPGDIEMVLAPQNFLFTHSINYLSSAFTQFGITADTILNHNWSVFLGLHSGSDMAPWYNGAKPTLQFFLQWISDTQKDSIWTGINSLNNGQYSGEHDNLQQFNLNWTHRFSAQFYIYSAAYFEFQYNAKRLGNCIFGPVQPYGGGHGCGPVIPGSSYSFALQNFIEYKLSEHNYSSLRTDYFNDYQGQRTGYATPYLSFTLGLTHLFGDYIKIRPELRYARAYNASAFDNGTRQSIFMGLIDFIIQT
jgi:hypothetical protein